MGIIKSLIHIKSLLSKASDYDVVTVLGNKQMTVQLAKKYTFDVQAAVETGRFPSILLELFTERGYLTDGKVVVCPASYSIMEVGVAADSMLSVIPVQNIDEVRGNENLRPLIKEVPTEFLTELTNEEKK